MRKFLYTSLFLLVALILTGCSNSVETEELKNRKTKKQPTTDIVNEDELWSEFTGEKGEKVFLRNGVVEIATTKIVAPKATYFNTKMPRGKTVYFFVVQDKDGNYRAAANGCQVCFNARMGFRQEGNYMICNTCGNAYPLEKIATEKGGCNPGPINPNLEVKNGQIIIEQSDLEEVVELF